MKSNLLRFNKNMALNLTRVHVTMMRLFLGDFEFRFRVRLEVNLALDTVFVLHDDPTKNKFETNFFCSSEEATAKQFFFFNE